LIKFSVFPWLLEPGIFRQISKDLAMKFKTTFLFMIVLAMLVSACSSSTPTAAPTAEPTNTSAPTAEPTNPPAPTETPAASADPVWDRVQSAGKLVFGTSADYQPFEYYDENDDIIGFDAALARNLGERLGLDVELVDIAFEGLPAALQLGQVDAAIAAISATPERQAVVDFTNVYFSGQDTILAREGSGIQPIASPAQLAQYRVGAQRGSIYASWVQKTLIDAGLIPQTNLLLYAKADEAVRDLRENRNDLVVLDKLAADEYILGGGVVSVGQSLNRQLFAIALPKGAATLQDQLNTALTALQNDGTLARLMETFLDIQSPVVTPAPLPTAVPGPTPAPAGCYDAMMFVEDVKVPDGKEMDPGDNFDKVWRLRNVGTCTWDKSYKMVFVQGDRMGGDTSSVTTTVKPGETYDMSIDQKAPNSPGKYTCIWQMLNGKGVPFGERIWVKITVTGSGQQPTATKVPGQPTSVPGPVIDYLNVSSGTVQPGELVVVSWSFSGQGLASATLTRTNLDGSQTPLSGGADVPSQGQYEDTPMDPGSYTYTLNVSTENAGSAVATAAVNVASVSPTATEEPPTQPTSAPGPVIEYLNVSSDTVQQGDVLVVSWSFSGEGLASATLTRTNPDGSQTPLNGGADVAPQDQYEDMMMDPGAYVYTLNVSTESGGSAVKSVDVTVNSN
jgi:ABC-type amino acid transport substrate-binding protein